MKTTKKWNASANKICVNKENFVYVKMTLSESIVILLIEQKAY